MTQPPGQRKMPTWLKITLWTMGGIALAVMLYFHLTSGGGPGRHL